MKELKLGERYTWKEVADAYPDRWVRMSECTLAWGSSIIDGILVGVYTDDEYDEADRQVWESHSKDKLRRTTSGITFGVIECLNAEMRSKDEHKI